MNGDKHHSQYNFLLRDYFNKGKRNTWNKKTLNNPRYE